MTEPPPYEPPAVDYGAAARSLARDQIYDVGLLRRLLGQGSRVEAAPAPADRIRGVRADAFIADEADSIFLDEVAAQFQAEGANRFFLPRGVELTPPPVSIPMAGEAPAAGPVVPPVEVGPFEVGPFEFLTLTMSPPPPEAARMRELMDQAMSRLFESMGIPPALFGGPVTFGTS